MDDLRSLPPVSGVREPIYCPDPAVVACSELSDFMRFCEARAGRRFADQAEFHRFSVMDHRAFWVFFLDWSGLAIGGHPEPVCEGDEVERASFFPNVRLSYVENLLARSSPEVDARPAIVAVHDDGRSTD